MRVINCPRCSGSLQVAPDQYLFGATRACPLCGTLIQLASEHKPIPYHRLRGKQPTESGGGIEIFTIAVLGIAMLCLLGAAAFRWYAANGGMPVAGSSAGGSGFAATILQVDRNGLKGRIRNNSGVALSRVAVNVRVSETGTPTPIIQRIYHLESAGGFAGGKSVDFQLSWEPADSKAYAMAKGRLTASIEVSAPSDAGGAPNVDLE